MRCALGGPPAELRRDRLNSRLGTLTKLLMGSAIQKKMDADVRNLDILKRILEIERS